MTSLIAEHGRLLVDRREFRWIPGTSHVICVGRVARAVNCAAIEARLVWLTAEDVEAAASFGHDENTALHNHRYEIKAHAMSLAATTATIPLLIYQTTGGAYALLDGRQRAAKALAMQAGSNAPPVVKAYLISEQDAFRTGKHPSLAQVAELSALIDDPIAATTFKDILRPIASDDFFAPIISHVMTEMENRSRDGQIVPGSETIAKALDIVKTRMEQRVAPKLLSVTMPRPIVFEPGPRPASIYRRVFAFSASDTRYRSKDEYREMRVAGHYRFYSLELVIIEEIIASLSRMPPFAGDAVLQLDLSWTKLSKGKTEARRRSCDAYLLAHWRAMGLDGKPSTVEKARELMYLKSRKLGQYLGFHTTDKNAAQIISNVGRTGDVGDMRRRLAAEVESIIQSGDQTELQERRDRAVERFRLYAKAYVRMRQSDIGKKVLVGMDDKQQSTLPKLAYVKKASRWDLDAKPTLVGFVDMMEFSFSCGVAATEVWPTFQEFNPFFECCALAYNCEYQSRLGAPVVTPTVVEYYHHRVVIREQGQIDGMSPWWSMVESYLNHVGLTRDIMARYLAEMDRRQGLDQFPMFEKCLDTYI